MRLDVQSSSSAAPASSAAASAKSWSSAPAAPARASACRRGGRRARATCSCCRRSRSSRPTSTTTRRWRACCAARDAVDQPRRASCTAARPSSSASTCSCRGASRRPARAAGVRRVVHVSALGAGADAPSRYLRSKARGEAALRARRPRPDGAAPVGDLRRARPLPEPVRRAAGDLSGDAAGRRATRASSRSGSRTSRARSCAASTTRRRSALTIECCRPARLHAARAGASSPAAGRARARPVLALPASLGRLQALLHGAAARRRR